MKNFRMISPEVVIVMTTLSLHIAIAEPCYFNTTSCISVNSSFCLTTKIIFSHTSSIFTNLSQAETENHLNIWAQLKGVPECWAVVQPFLCSVYFPKCDVTNQRVERPNRELCERIQSACLVVKEYNGQWLTLLQCDQWFFAETCGQTHYETSSFDITGECVSPLIRTTDEENWFESIQGCGVQCENPMFSEKEHEVAHIVIAIMGSICILCTAFTLLTFIIDWKVGRKYPAIILFFINGCFFIVSLGWMAQFVNREDVICRKDGTIRKGEPMIGSGESASCTIVFILVYYFTIAGVIWFVMLAYSWDITFKAIGTVRDDLSKKTAYFHIISWCLPLVLTIIMLTISEIDGDSLTGICFPGYFNTWIRTGFVLAPIGVVFIAGSVFCFRGLNTLLKVSKDTPPFISDKASTKIRESIFRLGAFLVLSFVFVIITTSVHIYTFTSQEEWEQSFKQYSYCQANISVMQYFNNETWVPCELEDGPSATAAIFHMLAFFGTCIALSSWVWTKASLEAWQRLFRRLFKKPVNKPQKMHRHRMIARSFKRRKRLNNERLSISYGTDHDDPVGMRFDRLGRMRFDRRSMSSHSLSSGFAVAVPKHERRRHGMKGREHKVSESDISMGTRRSSRRASSRSSRHDSYESSMSQKLSDIERDIREEERRRRRTKKRRRRRHHRIQPILEPISSSMAMVNDRRQRQLQTRQRRRSDSSDQSMISAHQGQIDLQRNGPLGNQSLGSSNILSESVTTGNSISEIELPQQHPPQITDFSMFTANTMLPALENKGSNSNGAGSSNTANLKGANPSPSGSFRRGRRREVKLEMTETSFYQEDDDNIEIGGNKTIHAQENCQESGEIRQNLKELGPLVTEMFEQARANSASGRHSGQRDPMGSSRLGSASSRGSKGSKGSQSNLRDFKYANTKVNLPPESPGHETNRKRPFSGDYILRRNNAKQDIPVRKSQSQPGSRVTSATSQTSHKRQIGNNGRITLGDGLCWSRFLQAKGYAPGQLFTPKRASAFNMNQTTNCPGTGQLQILDTGQQVMKDEIQNKKESVNILDVESKHQNEKPFRRVQFPSHFTKAGTIDVLDLNKDESEFNILNVEQEQKQNLLKVLGKKSKHKHGIGNVDVLNIEKHGIGNVDVLNIEAGQSQVNILDIEEEQRSKHLQNHQDNMRSASSGAKTSDSGSGSSKHSRHNKSNGIDVSVPMHFDKRFEASSLLPGVEDGRHYDLVDYDLDEEEYTGSEFTDDLTDTYTYTSYDDDLTEVSSLPC